jgi:hypothetical protein
MRKWFSSIYYSFPAQLLLLHIRSNLILLGLWVFVCLLMTGGIGAKYGINYLFISPEYLGAVNFWSFFFLGLGYGAMVMSWNLTTYLVSAHHFPFLATLSRPFIKFSLNNFLIPIMFATLLLYLHISFEWQNEYTSPGQIFENCLGFLFGFASLVVGLFVYFFFTNKDILSFLKLRTEPPPHLIHGQSSVIRRPVDVDGVKTGKDQWKVTTYLTENFRFRIVRSVAHYDHGIILRIFKQNHINALIVQLMSVIVLIILGYLIDNSYFRIPAGASVLLICSILIALTGAISYWFHQWRMAVLLLLVIGGNFITRYEIFNHKNKGYGLNYVDEPAEYTYERLESICSPDNITVDTSNTIGILERWKQKIKTAESVEKPKMVILCVSGGGLKSALWTLQVMRHADSLSNRRFSEHTTLISGASGGMIGSAYYRELYLRYLKGEPIELFNPVHLDRVSKDLLNSVAFTIATNDLFLPWVPFEAGGFRYVKDRGYSFERQLNENLGGLLEGKTLADYWEAEYKAQIPMLFVTPAIVNDGRRMIISPQGVSYMMASPAAIQKPHSVEIDAVDFGRVFEQQDALNLLFTSALRMNASFPYILPNVHLPSDPNIEVLDAGFRDDFGLKSAVRYLHVLKDWIKNNTSGVVLVQVRAFDREREVPASGNQGAIESILNPLGIAGKIISLQNYEHDTSIGFIYELLGEENFELIRFTYRPTIENKAATISLHLTAREQNDVLSAIDLPANRNALHRLVDLLSPPPALIETDQ